MVSYKDDDDEKKSKKGKKVKEAKKNNLTVLWIVIGVVVAIIFFLFIYYFFPDDGNKIQTSQFIQNIDDEGPNPYYIPGVLGYGEKPLDPEDIDILPDNESRHQTL